jgi:hypothetical protein
LAAVGIIGANHAAEGVGSLAKPLVTDDGAYPLSL